MNTGIIFLGQSKAKDEKNNHKDLCGVRIRKNMVRKGEKNGMLQGSSLS